MIQKKICLIGSFAVGKTSLVARFVQSMFSEKYHTTVGVKIDKKVVAVDDRQVLLMIWDIAGEDEFHQVPMSYLRGASGYLLVVDGTRKSTYDRALSLRQKIEDSVGPLPFIVLFNKADLETFWELGDPELSEITAQGWRYLKTSARTGAGVEQAFQLLAEALVGAAG